MNGKDVIEQAIQLSRSKTKMFVGWSDIAAISFIYRFMERKHACFVHDGSKCVGFGMIRYLDSVEESEDPLFQRDAGKIVWVDVVVADTREAFRELLLAMKYAMQNDGCNADLIAGNRNGTVFKCSISKLVSFLKAD